MSESAVAPLLEELNDAEVFDLEQPRYFGAPALAVHQPGFVYMLHRHHERNARRSSASGFLFMAEHSGTHIDALSHQAWEMELFGGIAATPEVQTATGFTHLGIDEVTPIFRRGVLLDVADASGLDQLGPGTAASESDLSLAAKNRDIHFRRGDVVLIRTGNGALWDEPEKYERGPGIDKSAAEWLAGKRVFAVGADNLALDVIGDEDDDLGALPAHTVLIVRNGIFIIENLFLEELASAKVREFLFVCLPLKMRGVTASPIRPLAVVPRASGKESGPT